jgi:hypothetical protein
MVRTDFAIRPSAPCTILNTRQHPRSLDCVGEFKAAKEGSPFLTVSQDSAPLALLLTPSESVDSIRVTGAELQAPCMVPEAHLVKRGKHCVVAVAAGFSFRFEIRVGSHNVIQRCPQPIRASRHVAAGRIFASRLLARRDRSLPLFRRALLIPNSHILTVSARQPPTVSSAASQFEPIGPDWNQTFPAFVVQVTL